MCIRDRHTSLHNKTRAKFKGSALRNTEVMLRNCRAIPLNAYKVLLDDFKLEKSNSNSISKDLITHREFYVEKKPLLKESSMLLRHRSIPLTDKVNMLSESKAIGRNTKSLINKLHEKRRNMRSKACCIK
eukprot:TRINITY_DN3688_c0_g4_i1.p1 TRINITY_DN3688_c0_g4~~TRINITY_DN3688_c0_g4_i1.p1  ORF type:complete len:130 (-),score=2.99 TRINITY_DN3688_c0_g4_i1:130-519(-)